MAKPEVVHGVTRELLPSLGPQWPVARGAGISKKFEISRDFSDFYMLPGLPDIHMNPGTVPPPVPVGIPAVQSSLE